MSTTKKYISRIHKGSDDLYLKDAEAQEAIERLGGNSFETAGAVKTIFDTYYDHTTGEIVFGTGCASFDQATGILDIEGQFEDGIIVIS